MTREHTAYAILLSVVLASGLFLMSKSSPREVNISVVYGTNDQLVLNIRNTMMHEITMDNLRFKDSNPRFNWELFSGKSLIAQGAKPTIEIDPRIPVHYWPTTVSSGDYFQIELGDYYHEFSDTNLLSKADTLGWHCRVWDDTAKGWIQAHGMVQLKNH